MPATFSRIPLVTLRGQIADRIREAVLHGTLKPGERIVERKLAAQFGASLTAIREALIALESEGFIIKKPNSSTFVMNLTFEDGEKIFRIRRVLEAYAFEEAARRAGRDEISHLQECHLKMVDAARANDLRRYVQRI